MSVYNGERFLKEAIDSIIAQTFTDFEFIIINDGSTDRTGAILKTYADPRLKIIERENRGLISSLNEAINSAEGEYLARTDADDTALPERLARQAKFLDEHPPVGLVGSWAEAVDENGKILKIYDFPPADNKHIRSYLLRHNAFIHPSVMFRRKLISQNPYRNFTHIEDYELWTRLLQKCEGANIPEPLIKYRVLESSITRINRKKIIMRGFFVRALVFLRLFLHLPV